MSSSSSTLEESPKGLKRKKESINKNAQGEPYWTLGRNRRVTVRTFKGKTLVDIREYYEKDDGEMAPGKKGISLNLQQYRDLKDLFEEIDEELGEDAK